MECFTRALRFFEIFETNIFDKNGTSTKNDCLGKGLRIWLEILRILNFAPYFLHLLRHAVVKSHCSVTCYQTCLFVYKQKKF
jgi:hypothetical protein